MTDRPDPKTPETAEDKGHAERLGARLFYMILIAVMLSLASSVLTLVTVLQFVIMLVSGGRPNERLAEFGEGLGIWIAKSARYQSAASEVKPWPWSDID